MPRDSKLINPDIHFRVLYILDENPNITQRELAHKLGISLGGINYCLKALIDLGEIKVRNFQKNSTKSIYLYLLTPKGIVEKTALTTDFLRRKMKEYHALRDEIESIQAKFRI